MGMIGFDYLGAANKYFPMQQTIDLTPNGSALGIFYEIFGDARPVIRKWCESGKFPVIRIHAEYNTAHNLITIDKLKQVCKQIANIQKDFPGTALWVSHTCEHRSPDKKEVKKRLKIVHNHGLTPVNSIIENGAYIQGEINERHDPENKTKPGDLTSWDGQSCTDGDVDRWHQQQSNAAIRFLWAARYNLRESTHPGDLVLPPDQRTAAPDAKYLKAIIRLGSREGTAPPPISGAIQIKRPLLWKTFAEDQIGENFRDNKPLFCCGVDTDKATIVASNGSIIGTLGRYPGAGDLGIRYYSGYQGSNLYGYEMSEKAMQACGSEWCYVKVGNKTFGPVNPAFRRGYFRDE